MNVKLTHKKWQFLCRKPACGFLVGLLVISTGLSSCRLDDNRIRGSYGPYPERGSGSDGTPDSFSFVAQSGLALSTLVESEIVPIVGIDKKVDIEVTGSGNSEYRVCSDSACAQEIKSWGAIAESSLVSQNNYVQIRLTSSSSYSTTVQAILSVGQTSASWEVTCLAAVTPLAEASWNQIVSGGSHTCGLASDGKAYCWGNDSNGQLGENADGDNLNENIPVEVDTSALSAGASFVSLTAGGAHTCGLASNGKAYCWGWDLYGQLGENADGDNLDENIPVEVDTSALSAGASFASLTAGFIHTCGLASDGKAYCWGWDGNGELGENADGDNLDENIPVLVDTSTLSAGAS